VILRKQYSGRKFFGFFPVIFGRFLRESTGIDWKKSGQSGSEYCFHVPAISGVFLQDPVTFPHLSCRIPRNLVAGIIDLGTLKICISKYENSNDLLCEKNVHLIELISLFHYSRLFVDNEQIEDIINEMGLRSYMTLLYLIFHDMSEYENNTYVYVNSMMNDSHVKF
jgi:hypothetical protein